MRTLLHIIPFAQNGVIIALIAHSLIGVSLVWDKVLLKRPDTTNLISYIFWLGAISIFGLALIPFGFSMPMVWVAALAFLTGALQLAAVYFYYAALKFGEASQTLAVMGGFSPVATALIGIPLLKKQLGGYSLVAFILLTAGGFVMFFAERVPLRKMLVRVVAASILFGFVNVLEKVVYDNTDFVSGYVFFTLGTFAGAMGLLLHPRWRNEIFKESEEAEPRSRFWYFVNRFMAGLGSFLIYYAISLTNPALVDAITAVRYVIIFLGAYLLTKLKPSWLSEIFTGRVLAGKIAATLMVAAGLVILGYTGEGGSSPSTRLPSPTGISSIRRMQLAALPPSAANARLPSTCILQEAFPASIRSPSPVLRS
jgi:drug/metabolite transporter (DMT)-like permease